MFIAVLSIASCLNAIYRLPISLFQFDNEKMEIGAETGVDIGYNYRYNQVMYNLEPHKLIEASPLFRDMHPRERADVIARLQPVSIARGTRILERGTWHGQLYIVASGLVSVLLQEDHNELAVAQLGPGECFGDVSHAAAQHQRHTCPAPEPHQPANPCQSPYSTGLALSG